MAFRTDQQTLNDLDLMHRSHGPCVFNIYNNTHTRGGALILERMFARPLSDEHEINRRASIIRYVATLPEAFAFEPELLDGAEIYLAMTDERTMLSHADDTLRRKLTHLVGADGNYAAIVNGILAIAQIVKRLAEFVERNAASAHATPYRDNLDAMSDLLRHEEISALSAGLTRGELSYGRIVDLDQQLRFRNREKIEALLSHVYDLDVFMSVAMVAKQKNHVFALAVGKERDVLMLRGLRHPLVSDARGNALAITAEQNVVFLTGANMAGKSTFMKALAIAFYVAHLGFPVAADEMQFSVADGLYTTINLSDDLHSGISHFYAEVMRLKKIATQLSDDKKLLVIFDELFRGTNVKDACEATIAITDAFTLRRNCTFVISTHIIEAGEELARRGQRIQFVHLPTIMEGNTPVYTYRLTPGITADRHGMLIIDNERIVELVRSRKRAVRVNGASICDSQRVAGPVVRSGEEAV